MNRICFLAVGLFLAGLVAGSPLRAESLEVLFLGDDGHHRPRERFQQLRPVMARRGIEVTYSDEVASLNRQTLAMYDGLIVYANIGRIEPEQEQALLDYVAGGHGFIPIHCASYCFLNSARYVQLVGAQFQRHGTGVFRTTIADGKHPIMRRFSGFECWDETYVHHRHHEEGRTVLEYRADAGGREPWTWVRDHGKGRVFYTAWGHDRRTWGHAGFQNLIERGIRWSCGSDPSLAGEYVDRGAFPVPQVTPPRKDVAPFEYAPAKIAFYPPGGPRRGDGEWNQMQLPLSPEESMKHLVTPVGFRVELFAAEPDIGKPITMNWDHRGRLWVAETVDYPNELQPEGEGRDRICICEDTDGDGRADKFTVFAEKLSIPTSLTFSRGGLIVHQAPHTLFLADTDGDDVADVREVLFSGWSTADTHAGPSNLHYGLDNWIWGMVGYAGFNGQIGGERQSFRTGFYRFRPDGSELEFIRNTNNNSWGVGFSEEGLLFGSTANRNPSVYMPIANRYYERVRGWSSTVLGSIADTHLFRPITEKVRQVDHHGGYTAAAGHALYTARTWPAEYWNRTAFVTGPTGHLVGTFVLNHQGSDLRSHNPFNLLASDDEWTAPTFAEVGPDGHVWAIDWYNYIVQHNPTPAGFKTGRGNAYETELRDKTHGRIYRVVYEAAGKSEPFTLADATPAKLVQTLAHPNLFWRRHAQRLLVERGESDVVPQLLALAGDKSVDAIGLNAGVIHALWTLQGLGLLDDVHSAAIRTAIDGLWHHSAGVRRNAVQVLPPSAGSLAAILKAGLLFDEDAQVRLAALLALSEMPANEQAARQVLATLDIPENLADRWILDAATSAAAAHDRHFLKHLLVSHKPAPRILEIGRIVTEHYARGDTSDFASGLLSALPSADPAVAEMMIGGLAKGWPKDGRVPLDEEAEAAIGKLFKQVSPGAKGQLIKLAAIWGSRALEKHAAEITNTLIGSIGDEQQTSADRIAAARQLISFRGTDDAVVGKLLDRVTPRTPSETAVGIIDALAESDAPTAGKTIVGRIDGFTPAAREAAIRVLLRRSTSTRALLDGIERGRIQLAELSLDQKQALATHPDRALRRRAKDLLARGGDLPSADRQQVLEELLPLAAQTGDVSAGKEVFKKQCANCHTHRGEGKKIGPDLTGMAVHPKVELLGHIVDPSRSVEGNYRSYTVVTLDGRVLTGLLLSETKTALELVDAQAKRHIVLREDIDELVASRKSVMPDGFEKQVKPAEIVDLLEFLTTKGRYVPLPLAKAATAVSTRGLFHEGDNGPDRLIFADWGTKTFEGVPFQLVDPRGKAAANIVLLHGPRGTLPPGMPRSVRLPCHARAKSIHLLSGVSGWGYPAIREQSVSMIVRLHYADGQTEDHALKNGRHFADYIRRVDVPESTFAFALRGQQIRYLAVHPQSTEMLREIEFVKGEDASAPIIMAVTVETPLVEK